MEQLKCGLPLLLVIICVLVSYGLPVTSGGGLKCLDAKNKGIDWYAVYKAPKLDHPKEWKFKNGLAYFYLDVNTPQWSLEDNAINDTDTAVYNTLQQIYKAKESDSIMYLMYNDQAAPSLLYSSEKHSKRGHTKGVLAFDGISGFWLSHSCPKFPPAKSQGYKWESYDYGQNLLCITFSYKELDKLSNQLLYNEPSVYDSALPEQFAKDFPKLAKIINRGSPDGPPWSSIMTLTSAGGQSFKNFAKSRKFGADLYDDLVAPTLTSDLYVETWLRSDGTKLNSNCSAKYKVYRVTGVSIGDNVQFNETKDHSKWAITAGRSWAQDSTPWVCIGDINRMESQFSRGGGTTCIQNQSVWKAFGSAVSSYQKCPVVHTSIYKKNDWLKKMFVDMPV